jgi:hypothetical protein
MPAQADELERAIGEKRTDSSMFWGEPRDTRRRTDGVAAPPDARDTICAVSDTQRTREAGGAREEPLVTDAELNVHLKAHVMSLKHTGELLEAERRERVRRADTAASLRRLSSLFDSAVHLHPPSTTSGLVQFYEILSRNRR